MGHEPLTKIFSTDKGIVALNSPVKLRILEFLRKGTKSFDELVVEIGKAKSTISVHLDDLQEMNLIEEKSYPEDKRKKYYIMNSFCLACSEIPMRNHYNSHIGYIQCSGENGNSFITHLFHTVRFGMEAYGFDPKPIMKRLGKDVGTSIGQGFESKDYHGLLEELSEFWKDKKLGNMKICTESDPAVIVTNCYHCSKMIDVGKTLCSMDEGIIEGVLFSRLNMKCNVKETECYGTGYKHCKFVLEKKGNDR